MTSLEIFLRLNGETLLYGIFFGAIAVFGLLETTASMRARVSVRVRRWPTNWGLTALNIMILGALPISALLFSDYARDNLLGVMNLIDLPLWASVVIGILIFSLQSWAVHYAMHYVPLF